MRLLPALMMGLVLPMAVACSPTSERGSAMDIEAEQAKLMDISRQWSALAAEGKDADRVAGYWAEDAVLMQDKTPTLRGRNAARQMVDRAFKTPGFKIEWEPIEAHVAASGDMGYIIERTRVTMPGTDGKPVIEQGRAVTVWRKDGNGEWRNAVDISNNDVKAD